MKKTQRGSILILVLWTLVFLSILTVVFGTVTRHQILMSERIEDRQVLYEAAYSGIMMALDTMSTSYEKDDTPNVDSLNDFWANDPSVFKDRNVGKGLFSFEYEYTDNITGKDVTRFGVIDENRKLNINYADEAVLKELFEQIGMLDETKAEKCAKSVIDWRDIDDIVMSADSFLSEKAEYSKEGLKYAPKNEDFDLEEELLLVSGIDLDTYIRIRKYITVFGDGRVNVNTASVPVLTALGISSRLAEKIVLYRSGSDRIEGTLDDNVFLSANDVLSDMSQNCDLTVSEIDELTKVTTKGVLTVESTAFRVFCHGLLGRERGKSEIVAVFDKSGNIKYWGYRLQEG